MCFSVFFGSETLRPASREGSQAPPSREEGLCVFLP
jgi:hypothetical protein